MEAALTERTVRTVDLFSGTGGLSLGFHLHCGSLRFHTVMALDNKPVAVRTYNGNLPAGPDAMIPTARVCDLTWFSAPSEVLLYYLVHYAMHEPDLALAGRLLEKPLEVGRFITGIREIDRAAAELFREISASADYRAQFASVDGRTFNLQIVQAFLRRLGFAGLRSIVIDDAFSPWRDEAYDRLAAPVGAHLVVEPIAEILLSVQSDWDDEVEAMREASLREGRGQHEVVAARLRQLLGLLDSPAGQRLRKAWIAWRASRDSLRAHYCTAYLDEFRSLYRDGRSIQLILGGPPCKGFSRIGRAVIESLRDQGVHAWVSKDYGDQRNALLHKYVLFLEALQPDAFVFENVSNFQSRLRTPNGWLDAPAVLTESIAELSNEELHYVVESAIVRTKLHAIPQDRTRYLMVGFNQAEPTERVEHGFFPLERQSPEVPLKVALSGLPEPGVFVQGSRDVDTGYRVSAYAVADDAMPQAHRRYLEWIRQAPPASGRPRTWVDGHIVRQLRDDDRALLGMFGPGKRWMDYKLDRGETIEELRQLIELTRSNGFDPKFHDLIATLEAKVNEGLLLRLLIENEQEDGETSHLLDSVYLTKGTDAHGDWFQRLSPERPSKTIVAHIGKDTYGFLHPYLSRAISLREAARIQSFPDFFSFAGAGVVDAYSLVGDAVPPLLANQLAGRLEELDARNPIFRVPPSKPAEGPLREQLGLALA